MVLSFTPGTHTYEVDGKPVPSVTGILKAVGLSGSFEFSDPIHAFRGTAVHEGAAHIISGVNEYPALEPLRHPHSTYSDYIRVHGEVPGYWDACRAAKAMIKFTGCIYEARFIDPARGYAGTFDFGAYVGGKDQLWDIKSGLMPIMTVVQICAYEDIARRGLPIDPDHAGLPWLLDLVKSGRPIERCGLRLEKTGRFTAYYECPKGRSYRDAMWMSAWRSALCLFTTVPDHEYIVVDETGKPRKRSHLSDMKWVAQRIKDRLVGLEYEKCQRAGENIWNIRSQYNLL